MTLGSLTTNQSWSSLLQQLQEELDKWGVEDYHLPYQGDARRLREVSLVLRIKGVEKTITCSVFAGQSKGEERNLCAIKEAVRAVRLADQRHIVGLLAEVAQLAALNAYDPWRVLGAEKDDLETARHYYHEKLKMYHPDNLETGSRPMLEVVQQAGRDLGL
ncbi:MAG: hypothetical protein IIA27_04485 [Gemmatimonadetes bacterium]|nr:hypothetical protein [Gemmatimonadota bacterium]